MTTNSSQKLKSVLLNWTPHGVVTHPWLRAKGVSPDLSRTYVQNGWLERLGNGTFKRPGETLTWQGALYSLQSQLGIEVHAGALTALASEGYRHYARSGGETVFLFSETGTTLPKWFREYPWAERMNLTQTRFLPKGLGVRASDMEGFVIQASAPERAILEALHLAPREVDLVEAAQVLEGLRTLRPGVMQGLLEGCTSIKVKRLFLYLAERADLPVVRHLNRDGIALGSGDRMIVPGGVHVPEFGLTVPRELARRG